MTLGKKFPTNLRQWIMSALYFFVFTFIFVRNKTRVLTYFIKDQCTSRNYDRETDDIFNSFHKLFNFKS